MELRYFDSEAKHQIEYPYFIEEEGQQGLYPYLDYENPQYLQIYSPFQPFQKKVAEFEMEPLELNKGHQQQHQVCKKVCIESLNSDEDSHLVPLNSSTASASSQNDLNEHDESENTLQMPQGELEQLVSSIQMEQMSQQIKSLPTPQQIEELWQRLQVPVRQLPAQQQFLSTYVNQEQINALRAGIDENIIHGTETHAFQEWVENLCKNDSSKMIKEMARKIKVNRYLEKKHGRTYSKKVHYQIRQKVAEERLRVKGRFVTWSQALEMLNEQKEQKKHWSMNDYYLIKKKLNEKFGSRKNKI